MPFSPIDYTFSQLIRTNYINYCYLLLIFIPLKKTNFIMKRIFAALTAAVMTVAMYGQGYSNPVIKGFNPDPSVCRVGDDYYLVTSTFQYFPGVPLYHSKDLIHWEQIGHVLDRESQIDLTDARSWGGVFAPTIRHHDGKFYMITTNLASKGNFIVTADDPRGEWSDPLWVDMPGIDPSLFWDDDGRCYYTGADRGCVFCEVNPDTGERLSEPKMIWYGTGGRSPEAPHIYKKDGWYYLVMAEGGTEFGHGVTVARSRKVDGPYESAPHNPILSHVGAAGQENPIQCVGHADIIQAHDGSWWMVSLGVRTQRMAGQHHLLGRETYLTPVRWDRNAWPVVNGNGQTYLEMDVPTLEQHPLAQKQTHWDFDEPLGPQWQYLRNPHMERYAVKDGKLTLYGSPFDLRSMDSPTFVCLRQEDHDFEAVACLEMKGAKTGDQAGLSLYMDIESHYDIYLERKGGKNYVTARYTLGTMDHTVQAAVSSSKIWLKLSGDPDFYNLSYSADGKTWKELGRQYTNFLSSETNWGFTGIMIGLWAYSPHADKTTVRPSDFRAEFDYFTYRMTE